MQEEGARGKVGSMKQARLRRRWEVRALEGVRWVGCGMVGVILGLSLWGCASYDDSETGYVAVVAQRTAFYTSADCGRIMPPDGYLEPGTRVRIVEAGLAGGECHAVEVGGRRGYVSRYDLVGE